MKNFSAFKIIQFCTLVVMGLISIFLLLNPEIKQYVFSTFPATMLFIMVWITLLASFVFLLIDLRFIAFSKRNYHELYGMAYSDSVSGIPNRFSCDVLIEKYIDSKLPNDIGCIMIDFSNLPDINTTYNHSTGNRTIKEFSDILLSCSLSLCFVGRNGGNKFLAIFEDCTIEKLNYFLSKVKEQVAQHNARPDAIPIEYRTGTALNSHEQLDSITNLIVLANKRVYDTTQGGVSTDEPARL